ncbi:MAG: hypothetical protein ACI4O4_02890 [Candidatus Ventricola sp.]
MANMYRYTRDSHNSKPDYPFLLLAGCGIAVSNVLNVGIYILLAVSLIFTIMHGRIPKKLKMYILMLFAVSYFLVCSLWGNLSFQTLKPFMFVVSWCMIYSYSRNCSISSIFKLIMVLAIGMALHGLANFAYNTMIGTNMISGLSYDVFTKQYSSATGQAVYFTLFVSIVFWAVFAQSNIKLKILGAVVFIASLLYDIQLGGRSFLVLAAISVFVGIVSYMMFALKNPDRKDKNRLILILLGFVVLIAVAIYLYENNYFGLKTWYETSYLFKRIEYYDADKIGQDVRVNLKLQYVRYFFSHIFGGNQISKGEGIGAAHELWLDVYDDAGLLSYVLLLFYTFLSVNTVYRMIKLEDLETHFKVGLIEYQLVMLAQFFVEPVFQGAPLLFVSYIMIDAALTRFYDDQCGRRRLLY